MPIREHPPIGTVLLCDFDQGFREPEMVKRRPVIVISPKISVRAGLCTVVALSTTEPAPNMAYHCQITLDPPLPDPWGDKARWVKGDMVCAVGFHRLDFPRLGKDQGGKRLYRYDPISAADLRRVRHCVLCSLGLAGLTKHLP
ncbi:type II toxin-antitoxin system PemK/MazF family toxin [Azospirillum sp.]|uniref:type II toxin-antitoxin system PemK/MazF family toxin n=1 Tax=Azospirillum sp. TaxID=34012 RepID=UPI002D2BED32|nr:type II toxin-antitoxin system PemK/MazF family toxin [Azospirillum sp.]HYF85489.1 type II toxin-antitoxin system PemK/MazF family toxin [Azospirillum sp.]